MNKYVIQFKPPHGRWQDSIRFPVLSDSLAWAKAVKTDVAAQDCYKFCKVRLIKRTYTHTDKVVV